MQFDKTACERIRRRLAGGEGIEAIATSLRCPSSSIRRALKRLGFGTVADCASGAPDLGPTLYEVFAPSDTVTDPVVPPPPAQSGLRTTLVISDVHRPYHDPQAWLVALEVARELRPYRVVIIGDWQDCYSVSKFTKDPDRLRFLRDELEDGRAGLRELETAAQAECYDFCEGNHEVRIPALINSKVPALHGMISIREYLGLDAHGWRWAPYKTSVRVGKMTYTHDVGRYGMYAARWTLADVGTNVTFGHTHKLCSWFEGNLHEGVHTCLNVGWLGDLDKVDYKHQDKARREFQHGLGVVYQDQDGVSYAHPVPIISGRCEVAGRMISA